MDPKKTNTQSNQESNYKIFIEQAPMAIAMLDTEMIYLAVSKRWISDYRMENQQVIGRSHYDLFPEIDQEWKEAHQRCLNGEVDRNDCAPFKRADGTIQWIFWDVRPWYKSNGDVGGLIMYTGDITDQKELENSKFKIEQILNDTSEIARVGTWEVDLIKQKVFWSSIVKDIHEVPHDFEPDLSTAINNFKEGESRALMQTAVNEAIEHGKDYDIEVQLVTAKGNTIWTRAVGKTEFKNGKCVRFYGIFQDIDRQKRAQLALKKANAELEAIFNSKAISIIATDNQGVITRFNSGAEKLLGYTSDEVIGKHRADLFLFKQEMLKFREDVTDQSEDEQSSPLSYKKFTDTNAVDLREWTFRKKDGTLTNVQSNITTIKNELGERIGFLNISTDISNLKHVENELRRKNQALNHAEVITKMGNWQWNTITNEVKWSANLYNIFQRDPNKYQLTYNSYFAYVHEEDKDFVTSHVQKSLAEKSFDNLVHRIQLENGEVKTIQLVGEVILDNQNNVIELFGTCQDVTKQKMNENKFRGLLESAPDAMIITNEQGQIQLINKEAENLFGYTRDELINKKIEILIPNQVRPNHSHHRNSYVQQPRRRQMGAKKDLYGLCKNGKEVPIQISLSPLNTEEGLLISAAIRDVTDQKLSESKLIDSKNNLELIASKLTIRNSQLADFAQITSHNLRAPVSNLSSLIDIYRISESQEEKEEVFKNFEKVTEHLTSTLNSLVEAVSIKEKGPNDLQTIAFDKVLKKTEEILVGEIIKTNATVVSDFSSAPEIKYSPAYLESIFLNLLSNSLKYYSHERKPIIHIKSQKVNNKISLIFQDNGLGIDLKKHGSKLFGLNKVFHRHPEAKGIGLFMTKTQIESMGGSITAESEKNEGITFTINFNQHHE